MLVGSIPARLSVAGVPEPAVSYQLGPPQPQEIPSAGGKWTANSLSLPFSDIGNKHITGSRLKATSLQLQSEQQRHFEYCTNTVEKKFLLEKLQTVGSQ